MPQPSPILPSPQPAAEREDVAVNFFKNYNRVIGLAYGAILLGLLAFFLYQLREKLGLKRIDEAVRTRCEEWKAASGL